MYSVGRGFVGGMHLESTLRLLGHTELPVVLETIIEHMKQKVGSTRGISYFRQMVRTPAFLWYRSLLDRGWII